ncbi:hypothetical protein HOY82DRAFT_602996 [Tuber indicum]|nr:hypothetical protein HOY82DRAFT_602996 [Tuber indicum]
MTVLSSDCLGIWLLRLGLLQDSAGRLPDHNRALSAASDSSRTDLGLSKPWPEWLLGVNVTGADVAAELAEAVGVELEWLEVEIKKRILRRKPGQENGEGLK